MRRISLATVVGACCLAGCPQIFEADTATSPAQDNETAGQAGEAAGPPVKPPTGLPPSGGAGQGGSERVKAEAGVAAAGRSLDDETGVVVEPAKALFAFRENAVFKIQIPQALQLFRATEGRLPQSHQEFMTRIVQANNLRLPELPPGQTYQFDPERGELMVVRPTD